MEEILKKLVAIPSVSGDKKTSLVIVDYIAKYVTARGLSVRRFMRHDSPSLVATVQPDDVRPTLLLVAHADVVPATPEMFTVTKKDGKYYGRGVFDMKFAVAAFLKLIDELAAAGTLQEYSLGLMVTTDEEIGGRNGAKYLVEEIGYRPKVCIIPDGGPNWQMEAFAKGVMWMKLEAKGLTGHASRPWEGDHAVDKLLYALAEIRGLFTHHSVDRKASLLSVGTITGGEAANQLAESASAVIDVRFGSMADYQDIPEAIQKIAQQYAIKTTRISQDPPCNNSPDNHYINQFRQILSDTLGKTPLSSYSYAATDGRFFSLYDIPCVIVQPPGGGHHGENEWVSVQGCTQFYEMLTRYTDEVARESLPHSAVRLQDKAVKASKPDQKSWIGS